MWYSGSRDGLGGGARTAAPGREALDPAAGEVRPPPGATACFPCSFPIKTPSYFTFNELEDQLELELQV
jgi:hypothetical protein